MTATSSQLAPPPIIHANPRNETLNAKTFLDGETVTMHFPKPVKLQLDDGAGTVEFYPGTQEVPRALANHWWLKSNGVKAYGKGIQKPSPEDPVQPLARMTERELGYMQSQGWRVYTVPDAQMSYENMDPIARPEFLKAAQKWAADVAAKAERADFDLLERYHLEFMRFNKMSQATLEAAQEFFEMLPHDNARRAFLERASAWRHSQEGLAVELADLDKAALVAHAAEYHGLELEKSDTKRNLVEAIEKARG